MQKVYWYKTKEGKILKGYLKGEMLAPPYDILLSVPHLHNKLVQVSRKECFKEDTNG